jgi:hypothetical protein
MKLVSTSLIKILQNTFPNKSPNLNDWSNKVISPLSKLFFLFRPAFLVLILGISQCSKTPTSQEQAAFLFSLAQNPSEESGIAILDIEKRDIGSYLGKCYDGFRGISAGQYFQQNYPREIRDTDFKKVVLVQEPCNRFGFSGGVDNRIDGTAVAFRSYSCGPATSLCTGSAVREAGFE